MPNLFNKYEAYTQEAQNLCQEFEPFCQDLIQKYSQLGYSKREIILILINSVMGIGSEEILRSAMKRKKEEEEEKKKEKKRKRDKLSKVSFHTGRRIHVYGDGASY